MRTAILAGASGLVGSELLPKLIDSDQYSLIYVLSRQNSGFANEKVREFEIDFDSLAALEFNEPIDDVFCTLGTTMKKAGNRDQFMKVDYGYVIALANLGKKCGATRFIYVSAMGADPDSSFFYNRVKGMTERALINMEFDQLVILRPSLLLGNRTEVRPAERISAFFMKAFNRLIPDNYKAIPAERVAQSMLQRALNNTQTVTIVRSGDMHHV